MTADQASKTWAEDHLAYHSRHVLGPVWFRLTYNSGAAFSLGRGLAPALAILAVLAVVAIFVVTRRASSWTVVIAGGMLAGGALGNLADRVFRDNHGSVIDFIWTSFWPTFNLADACITIGVVVLAVMLAWQRRPVPSEPA